LLYESDLFYKKINYTNKYYNLSDLHFSKTNNMMLDKQCNRKCGDRLECIKYYYTYDKSKESAKNLDTYTVVFEFPSEPSVIYEISLKMSFEEYLSLTASIISLWFGFSILFFTKYCQNIFMKLNLNSIFMNIFNLFHFCNINNYRNNTFFINVPRPQIHLKLKYKSNKITSIS